MDVKSLYPNIDHSEGIDACKIYLELRKSKTFSTNLLAKLMKLVLKSNVMTFGSRIFHQVKGTAMGTPMAVSYANLFMNWFETNMLNEYENLYNKKPEMWY